MSNIEATVINRDQLQWKEVDVRGTPMMEARVMNGEYGIYSAFYRLPKGTEIRPHRHISWVQVTVFEGAMSVADIGGDPSIVGPGGSYVVPPGGRHTEKSVADTLVLVTSPDP